MSTAVRASEASSAEQVNERMEDIEWPNTLRVNFMVILPTVQCSERDRRREEKDNFIRYEICPLFSPEHLDGKMMVEKKDGPGKNLRIGWVKKIASTLYLLCVCFVQ